MIFFGQVIGALLDPLAIIGYLAAGLVGVWAKRWWVALALAGAWAAVMEFISYRLASSLQYEYAFGDFLLVRIVGGLLVAALVFGIAQAFCARPTGSAS